MIDAACYGWICFGYIVASMASIVIAIVWVVKAGLGGAVKRRIRGLLNSSGGDAAIRDFALTCENCGGFAAVPGMNNRYHCEKCGSQFAGRQYRL